MEAYGVDGRDAAAISEDSSATAAGLVLLCSSESALPRACPPPSVLLLLEWPRSLKRRGLGLVPDPPSCASETARRELLRTSLRTGWTMPSSPCELGILPAGTGDAVQPATRPTGLAGKLYGQSAADSSAEEVGSRRGRRSRVLELPNGTDGKATSIPLTCPELRQLI